MPYPLTKYTSHWVCVVDDEVHKLLHGDVCFTLCVLEDHDELVVRQDAGVIVHILERHLSTCNDK